MPSILSDGFNGVSYLLTKQQEVEFNKLIEKKDENI